MADKAILTSLHLGLSDTGPGMLAHHLPAGWLRELPLLEWLESPLALPPVSVQLSEMALSPLALSVTAHLCLGL